MNLTIAQLAEQIGAELSGDGAVVITGIGPIEAADKSTITFITSDKHRTALEKSRAAAVIVDGRTTGSDRPQLIVKDVNTALIEVLSIFAPKLKAPAEGVDPTAKIGQGVKISKGVCVGAGVIIDNGAEIGAKSIIASGCKIGENSKVGKNCRFDNNVVVYHNCTIGNNVIIQANSTIGASGFGYSFVEGAHKLIPHIGRVVIEDFVEIGANSCIDRAKFGATIIGAGTKIDNLVQIAHNVVIGKCCLIAGQVGIAGSAKIGDGVVMGGQSGTVDHVEVGNGTMVAGRAVITHNVEAGSQMFGMPATDKKKAFKIMSLTRHLPKLIEQFKQLSARVKRLEAAKDDKE